MDLFVCCPPPCFFVLTHPYYKTYHILTIILGNHDIYTQTSMIHMYCKYLHVLTTRHTTFWQSFCVITVFIPRHLWYTCIVLWKVWFLFFKAVTSFLGKYGDWAISNIQYIARACSADAIFWYKIPHNAPDTFKYSPSNDVQLLQQSLICFPGIVRNILNTYDRVKSVCWYLFTCSN